MAHGRQHVSNGLPLLVFPGEMVLPHDFLQRIFATFVSGSPESLERCKGLFLAEDILRKPFGTEMNEETVER